MKNCAKNNHFSLPSLEWGMRVCCMEHLAGLSGGMLGKELWRTELFFIMVRGVDLEPLSLPPTTPHPTPLDYYRALS